MQRHRTQGRDRCLHCFAPVTFTILDGKRVRMNYPDGTRHDPCPHEGYKPKGKGITRERPQADADAAQTTKDREWFDPK